MQESHELDGTTVVVDRATPKVRLLCSEIELNGGQIELLPPTRLSNDTFVIVLGYCVN